MHNTPPTASGNDTWWQQAQLTILKSVATGNQQPPTQPTILPEFLIALAADAAVLYDVSPDQTELLPVASAGVELPANALPVSQCDNLAHALTNHTIQAIDHCTNNGTSLLADGMQQGVLVPITVAPQQSGMLCIARKEDRPFSADDFAFLAAVKAVYSASASPPHPPEQQHDFNLLEAITQTITDAVLLIDHHDMIYSANRPARMLLNLHSKALMAKQIGDIPMQPKIRTRLHQVMHHLNAEIAIFDLPLDDGRIFSAIFTRLPKSTSRLSEGWALFLRDVSHIRELEKAQARAIRDAIHDLKNPLGVTLGAVVMLEDIMPHDALSDELLDLSVGAIKNMENLIDNLLNIQHIQHRETPPSMLIDIEPALWRAIQLSQETLTQKQQSCQLDIDGPLPPIMAVEPWFVQAVHTYLNNASEISPAKSSINLHASIRGTELCVEVRDSGESVNPTVTGENWSDFYRHLAAQVEEKGNKDMMFVKSVAEAHGGSVYMMGKPGQGNTHGLSLPLTTKEP